MYGGMIEKISPYILFFAIYLLSLQPIFTSIGLVA